MADHATTGTRPTILRRIASGLRRQNSRPAGLDDVSLSVPPIHHYQAVAGVELGGSDAERCTVLESRVRDLELQLLEASRGASASSVESAATLATLQRQSTQTISVLAAQLSEMQLQQRRKAAEEAQQPAAGTAETPASNLPVPPLPPDDEGTRQGEWSLGSWVESIGVHRAVAAALQAPLVAQSGQSQSQRDASLAFLKGLAGREEVAALLSTDTFRDTLVALVWAEVQSLQTFGAATGEELESKFAGALELSYSGLDTFFGGLEGIVGSPNPKIKEGMEHEHTRGPSTESKDWFTTGNYSVTTTSEVEWAFVVEDGATPAQFGLPAWPVEAPESLPEGMRDEGGRQRQPLATFEAAATALNEQLTAARQPRAILEELIAARLYTGPMFTKYNAVLRGLRSESDYLRNAMVVLCCPSATATRYLGGTPRTALHLPPAGHLSFEDATQWLNPYTTTLHGVNSAVIKLGKLTVATKVYRGIAGKKLPPAFWTPNAYGVKGGVEQAFMSTTAEREVAMGYASGGSPASAGGSIGIVLEVQQGMVNRGADISFLSQYPSEREILFGPLTGIEVLRTRIEGSAVIIECALSINLTALTLEQVLGKRQKLVADMCDQLALKARRAAERDAAWAALRVGGGPPDAPAAAAAGGGGDGGASTEAVATGFRRQSDVASLRTQAAVEAFLQAKLMPVADKPSTHYNENEPLSRAITEAVAAAEILEAWPTALPALAAALDTTPEALQLSAAPVVLPKDATVSAQLAYGLCALMWLRDTVDLSLIDCKLPTEAVTSLARAAQPSLRSLSLDDTLFTNDGDTLDSLRDLLAALRDRRATGGLHTLSLRGNRLFESEKTAVGSDTLEQLVAILRESTTLTALNLLETGLDTDSARTLAEIGTERRILLAGMSHDQTEYAENDKDLVVADALLIASDLQIVSSLATLRLDANSLGETEYLKADRIEGDSLVKGATVTYQRRQLVVSSGRDKDNDVRLHDDIGVEALAGAVRNAASLTSLDVFHNGISDVAAAVLADAVLVSPSLVAFNGVPIKEMRANALSRLDLGDKRIGSEGSIALALLLPKMPSLTWLSVACNAGLDAPISGQAAQQLASAVVAKKSLKVLSGLDLAKLRANKLRTLTPAQCPLSIGVTEAVVLQKLMQSTSTSLTDLECVSGRPAGDAASPPTSLPPPPPTLSCACFSRHRLQKNEIGVEGLIAISHVVATSGVLRTLDVSQNQLVGLDNDSDGTFSAEGVLALSEALKATRCLTDLALRNNLLQPEGFRALAPGVAACRTLRELDVSENEMAPDVHTKCTFLSAKPAPTLPTTTDAHKRTQHTALAVGMAVDARYWMDKESKRKESGRWLPAVIHLVHPEDGSCNVTYLDGGKESRVRPEHLKVRWQKGDRAMYLDTGDHDAALHTRTEAAEALVIEESDRGGTVEIKVLSGAIAMAHALAQNTSLTSFSYRLDDDTQRDKTVAAQLFLDANEKRTTPVQLDLGEESSNEDDDGSTGGDGGSDANGSGDSEEEDSPPVKSIKKGWWRSRGASQGKAGAPRKQTAAASGKATRGLP